MEQLKGLSSRQKARLISFALIVAYLLYGVLAYAWDVREMTPEIEYVDSVQVDGSEFAPIANLFVAGTNGLVAFVTQVMSVVAMFVIALILLVPWRLVAIRKSSVVEEIEWKVSRYLLSGFVVFSVGFGLIILRFTNLIYILLMVGITSLFIWLLGVLPMKRACERSADTDGQECER